MNDNGGFMRSRLHLSYVDFWLVVNEGQCYSRSFMTSPQRLFKVESGGGRFRSGIIILLVSLDRLYNEK